MAEEEERVWFTEADTGTRWLVFGACGPKRRGSYCGRFCVGVEVGSEPPLLDEGLG